MRQEVNDHVDWTCLEVNYTALAEDAADHFHDYEEDDDIHPAYFEIAIEVGVEREEELQKGCMSEQL